MLLTFSLLLCCCSPHDKNLILFPIKEYGKWGFIDQYGSKRIACQYDYATDFHEGLAAVSLDSLWGFINMQGTMVIKPQYVSLDFRYFPFFSDGMSLVQQKTDSGIVNLFIKPDGRVAFIAPYDYWSIGPFFNGRAKISIDEEVRYINKRGRVVINSGMPYGDDFREGLGHVWTGDSTVYVDTIGNIVIALSGMAHGTFYEGLAEVSTEPNYFMDQEGKRAFTCPAGDFIFREFSNGFAQFYDREDNKHGFIDRKGQIMLAAIYDRSENFQEELCAVVRNDGGRWEFIDKKGNTIIPARFDDVRDGFQDGLCWVKENHRWGYINRLGEYVWQEQFQVQYDKIDLAKWKLDTLTVFKPMDEIAFGGYDNFVRQGNVDVAGNLSIRIDTADITAYSDRFMAYKLYLVNGSRDTVWIPTQDARLKMILQAVNEHGEWQDLNNFYNSFCGVSYRSYPMPPGGYQIFPAPFFKGEYRTKFRYKLIIGKSEIYSNTFRGSMNPGQFLDPAERDEAQISLLVNY
jgi:hypothetical protein